MSLEAYQKRQAAAEKPRETEYRLFGRVTGALIAAQDKGLQGAQLMEALDRNRRLWSTLATDCALPDNALPEAARAQIISLSIYVSKTTSKVMRGQAEIGDLVGINKIIMEGLAQQQAASQPQPERPVAPSGGYLG